MSWLITSSNKLQPGRGLKFECNAQTDPLGAALPHCVAFYRLDPNRLLYLDVNKSIRFDDIAQQPDPFVRSIAAAGAAAGVELMPAAIQHEIYTIATQRTPDAEGGCGQFVEACEDYLLGSPKGVSSSRKKNREAILSSLNVHGHPAPWTGPGLYRKRVPGFKLKVRWMPGYKVRRP